MNPLTKKPFYVGIGTQKRCLDKFRDNRYHKMAVKTFPDNKFDRLIIYKNILVEDAYRIEMQIIKRCGRVFDGSGYLTNIHCGGPLEFYSEYGHNYRGKKMRDIYGDDYVHHQQGKPLFYMHPPEKRIELIAISREKSKVSRAKRIEIFGKSEKELNAGKKTIERHKKFGFSENELKGFEKSTEKKRGRTMKEATGNPNWISYKLGKTHKELFGDDYVNPKKGRRYVEPKIKKMSVDNYMNPKAKPFKLILNGSIDLYFQNEKDFMIKTKFHNRVLHKLRKIGLYTIQRKQINANYEYNIGDTFEYHPITLDEYKSSLI